MYSNVRKYLYSQRSADTISLQAPTSQDLTIADSLQDKSDVRALREFKTYINIINDFYNTYKDSTKVVPRTFYIYCQYLTVKCMGLPDYKIYKKINITNKPLQRYKAMYNTMFYNFVKNK